MIKFLILTHRWTGIVLAAYLTMMGLTGAALVVHDDAARMFREPAVQDLCSPALDADQIVAKIDADFPGWHLQTLWYPDREARPSWFAEIRRGAVGAIGETALAIYLHPQSGEVLRTHNYSRSIWRWMQLLHFNLLSGRNGRIANGILALSTVFSTLTGVLLWWRGRLWWMTSARRRRWWELHQLAGIYTTAFLLLVCLTGGYFAWRADVHRLIAMVAPIQFMNRPVAPIVPSPSPPFETLVSLEATVRAALPDYPVTRVLFPDRPDQPIRFEVYEGSPEKFYKASNLFLHPATGELLRADLVRDRRAGDSILHWIGAVHFGAFGGWPVKAIWMLGGAGLSLLAISGVLLFLQRRQGR